MGIHLFPKREKKEEKKMRYVFFFYSYIVRTTLVREYELLAVVIIS